MVNEAPPENRASPNGIAVASPPTTSTLLPRKREPSDSAALASISRAVRRSTPSRNSPVVRPGPGPSSRTFCPRSACEMTHGTRCWTVFRHRAERHNQWCKRFTRSPQLTLDRPSLTIAGSSYFRHCDNECRRSAKVQFSNLWPTVTPRLPPSRTTIPRDTWFPLHFHDRDQLVYASQGWGATSFDRRNPRPAAGDPRASFAASKSVRSQGTPDRRSTPLKVAGDLFESMNRSKALSSLWVGHRPIETPSKDAPNSFRISEPQQRVFHSHGWAAGQSELHRKSRVTCLESMDLRNGLSSLWVGHRPMGTSLVIQATRERW